LCELMLLALALLAGHMWATIIAALALVVPLASQIRLYREPTHKNFLHYIVMSNPFVLLLQFISVFIVGGYFR
ncbi:MAG: bacteriochlorophyll/chlorophyll synthetase, partial [Chloroflexales bacterium]